MSGIEILGLAASVLQIAELGGKLSVQLFTFTRKVKRANKSIDALSQELASTGAVLRQLGEALNNDDQTRVCSQQSVDAAKNIVSDTGKVFIKLESLLASDGSAQGATSFMQKLKYPFIEPQIEQLQANLERLKSSLLVILNVLIFAEQLRNQETLPILKDQRELIRTLAAEKAENEKRYENIMKAISGASTVPAPVSHPRSTPGVTSSVASARSIATTTAIKVPDSPVMAMTASPSTLPSLKTDTLVAQPPPKDLSIALASQYSYLHSHATLVQSLLADIDEIRYDLKFPTRSRMRTGVLEMHWEEWEPRRREHGTEELERLLATFPDVYRFWRMKGAPVVQQVDYSKIFKPAKLNNPLIGHLKEPARPDSPAQTALDAALKEKLSVLKTSNATDQDDAISEEAIVEANQQLDASVDKARGRSSRVQKLKGLFGSRDSRPTYEGTQVTNASQPTKPARRTHTTAESDIPVQTAPSALPDYRAPAFSQRHDDRLPRPPTYHNPARTQYGANGPGEAGEATNPFGSSFEGRDGGDGSGSTEGANNNTSSGIASPVPTDRQDSDPTRHREPPKANPFAGLISASKRPGTTNTERLVKDKVDPVMTVANPVPLPKKEPVIKPESSVAKANAQASSFPGFLQDLDKPKDAPKVEIEEDLLSRISPSDPRSQWEIDQETERLKRLAHEEERQQKRKEEAERRRIRSLLEQEDKERRKQQAAIEAETERLRQIYGRQDMPISQQPRLHRDTCSGGSGKYTARIDDLDLHNEDEFFSPHDAAFWKPATATSSPRSAGLGDVDRLIMNLSNIDISELARLQT